MSEPTLEPRACVVCSQSFVPTMVGQWLCGSECTDRYYEIVRREAGIRSDLQKQQLEAQLDDELGDDDLSEAEKAREGLDPTKRFVGLAIPPDEVSDELDSVIALLTAVRSLERVRADLLLPVVLLARESLDRVSVALGASDRDGRFLQVDHLPPGERRPAEGSQPPRHSGVRRDRR